MLRPLVLLAGALAPLPAQDVPFPKLGADPDGVVLDEHGARLAGCRVELLALHEPGDPYARALDAVLARAPLPHAVTEEGGRFVLRLTREQRLLGCGGAGRFALRVAKDGYQTWLEPLPDGIGMWLGSRVVLAKARAEDRLVFRVTNPAPGLRLGLRRNGELGPEPYAWFDVPADGRMAVPFAVAPLPAVSSGIPGPLFIEAVIASGGTIVASRHLENVIEPLELTWRAEAAAPAPRPADAPQIAGVNERGSLELRVHDPAGKPIPGACVLLCGAALDRPGRAPPLGAADGIVRIDDLPARGIEFLVLAEGFLAGTGSCIVDSGARRQGSIALRPHVLRDLRTCRDGGGIAAHVALAVTVREPGEKRGRTEMRVTDSLGRLRIVTARDCDVLVRPLDELPRGDEGVGTDAVTELADQGSRLAVLRLGPGEYVTDIECSRRYEFRSAGQRNPTAWSVGGLRRDEDVATFYLADAPPLRVFGAELRGDGKGACPALVVDRPRVTRRIALDVTGPNGSKITPLRITPGTSNKFYGWRRGSMLEVGADGEPAFVARDMCAYECTLWHPEYLPCALSVAAQRADAADPRLVVRLEAGSPVAVRITFAGEPPAAGTEYMLRLSPAEGDFVLLALDRIGSESLAGRTLTLRAPAAVPGGELELVVTIPGYDIARRTVKIEDGKPCVGELEARVRR